MLSRLASSLSRHAAPPAAAALTTAKAAAAAATGSSSRAAACRCFSSSVANDVLYTDEHREMMSALSKIIEKDINPYVDQWEEAGIFPAHKVFKTLGDAGFLGVNKPVEFGGMGLDYSYAIAVAEQLGEIRAGGVPMAIGVQTDMATPALAKFGSDHVRHEFLAPSIAGDMVACLGVSEPGAGSDVASTKTTAVKDGDDYIVNGTKMWTTSGTQADWICLLANTSDDAPHKNKSLMCVRMDSPGISTAPRFKKLGMRCSDTTQVFFEDVRVPQKNLIGKEGAGFTYQMIQFQEERLFAAANLLRGLDRMIEITTQYTMQRQIFGQPLAASQVVQFKMAELETEVEALRSLVYRATHLYIQNQDVTKLASMAKLKGGRVARLVGDACIQYWGGMGYMDDMDVVRGFRDMRLLSIAGGADEVMLSILAKIRAKEAMN